MIAQDMEYRFGYFWNVLPAYMPLPNPFIQAYQGNGQPLLDYRRKLMNAARNLVAELKSPSTEVVLSYFDDSDLTVLFDDDGNHIEEITDLDILSEEVI